MSARKIYIVPDGGLGNRLRAIVSGIFLAREIDAVPIIVWHRDSLCNVALDLIIQTDKLPARIITPPEHAYRALYEIPRRRNLMIPALLAPMKFSLRFYDEVNLRPYCDDCPALLELVKKTGGKSLFFSGQEFYDFPRELFREIICPTNEVISRATEILAGRNPEFTVQIRRTDHLIAIERSPLDLFLNIIRQKGSLPFFLATDDQEVKRIVTSEFPDRVIINLSEANRGSSDGLIDAMAEIYIMSLTRRIYASAGSSFPVIAAWLGSVPLTPVSR